MCGEGKKMLLRRSYKSDIDCKPKTNMLQTLKKDMKKKGMRRRIFRQKEVGRIWKGKPIGQASITICEGTTLKVVGSCTEDERKHVIKKKL